MAILMRSAAAATVLGLTIGASAFAQEATQGLNSPYSGYAGAGAAPACTQLELIHGIRGDECGKLSLTELAQKKFDRDNQ